MKLILNLKYFVRRLSLMVKVDLFVFIFISCVVFLAAVKIPIRFDANTFFVTGERVLAGDVYKIYDSINGSGPFAYAPWVSFLMVPFSIFGNYLNLVAAFSALSMLGIIWTLLNVKIIANECLEILSISFVENYSKKYGGVYIGRTMIWLVSI